MANSGFYADNAHRSYPLLQDRTPTMTRSDTVEVTLPDPAIVDFGCVVGLEADYADDQNSVMLYSISRSGNDFEFIFRSDAPGLVGWDLRFVRNLTDPEDAFEEAGAESAAGSSSYSASCGESLLWEGWLVTGSLEGLAAILSNGQSMVADEEDLPLEPCLVQNLGRSYVRSINVANAARTRVDGAQGCAPPAEDPSDDYAVQAVCLAGALRLVEGYNCAVAQSVRENSLTVSARKGAGAGEPCDEVPLYEGETPPDGSDLLSGGPTCGEVLRSINGVSGEVLRLVAGQGASIAPAEDDPHTLVIDLDLNGLAGCQDLLESSESSSA